MITRYKDLPANTTNEIKCKFCPSVATVECAGGKTCKSCLRNVFGIKDMTKY